MSRIGKVIGSALVPAIGAVVAGGVASAEAGTVDIRYRLQTDNMNIRYLDPMTDVVGNESAYDIPHGDVKDQNGNMLSENQNFRLLFKDSGGQVVGITPIDHWTSTYDCQGDGTAIYGNLS